LANCRNIVTYFHKSSQALELLHTTQANMEEPKLGLIQDVQNRWSSSYLMLQRLLKIRKPLTVVLTKIKYDLLLTNQQWQMIEQIVSILKPFADATVTT
jgi:hypothetical protein